MVVKRKFSPVRSDDRLEYTVDNDVVTVKHKKYVPPIVSEEGELEEQEPVVTTDTFDFGGLGDGVANVQQFETTLPLNPFISAKRVDGVLELELINFIGANATEDEKFPEWGEF